MQQNSRCSQRDETINHIIKRMQQINAERVGGQGDSLGMVQEV